MTYLDTGDGRLLADQLFKIGAVKFGEFKLKLHEKNPDAPLSPFYFNLRTPDNPKPGDTVTFWVRETLFSSLEYVKIWLFN